MSRRFLVKEAPVLICTCVLLQIANNIIMIRLLLVVGFLLTVSAGAAQTVLQLLGKCQWRFVGISLA